MFSKIISEEIIDSTQFSSMTIGVVSEDQLRGWDQPFKDGELCVLFRSLVGNSHVLLPCNQDLINIFQEYIDDVVETRSYNNLSHGGWGVAFGARSITLGRGKPGRTTCIINSNSVFNFTWETPVQTRDVLTPVIKRIITILTNAIKTNNGEEDLVEVPPSQETNIEVGSFRVESTEHESKFTQMYSIRTTKHGKRVTLADRGDTFSVFVCERTESAVEQILATLRRFRDDPTYMNCEFIRMAEGPCYVNRSYLSDITAAGAVQTEKVWVITFHLLEGSYKRYTLEIPNSVESIDRVIEIFASTLPGKEIK